jgi:hypothetical protein
MHTKFRLETCKWKGLIRIPRNRWKDNIKINYVKKRYQEENWTTLAWGRGQESPCGHNNEPSSSLKDMEFLDYFSEYTLYAMSQSIS